MPEELNEVQPTNPPGEDEEIRIAVYTCHCGGNISDVVQCGDVAELAKGLPDVVVSRTHEAMCSDLGQAMIEEDIKKHGVNRVVVAACAPSLHEQTFRNTVSRAGLNPYLYHHVGVREQDSWVHESFPCQATDKALRLLSAGVAKAHLLQPLEPIRLDAVQHALVIGGGVSGLRAAWDIARMGIQVTLLEKSPFLGGRMAQIETMFPTDESAREALHRLIGEVVAHPRITVYTNTELVSTKGYVGDFQVEARQVSRGVSEGFADLDKAAAVCPVEVPDEFNYGLTTRKAIYQRYPGAYPATPAIDWENCTLCGECAQAVGEGINLQKQSETIALNVGAIVVATGFDLYTPHPGEYGHGELPQVITLAQFIRLMALTDGQDALTWNGRPVRDVAFIHCVGSRQIEGVHEPQPDGQVNTYCSRICCTATLHATVDLKERYPDVHVFDVYQDIRTYGKGHEEYYTAASANGVRFLRYNGDDGPNVVAAPAGDTHPVLVRVTDHLTYGEEIEIPTDLVVLATGIMPPKIDDLVKLLKISPGADRFLLEVHPKLRPVETAVPGIVLAGTAQSPMNIHESSAAASAAAAKVSSLLRKGMVELQPFVAKVNADLCDGNGACVEVCQYEDAISLQTFTIDGREVKRAIVTPANCAGCGACVSACPNRAIDVMGWTLAQYEAVIDAITTELPQLLPEVEVVA
jgi:heterodisulfide reductase subunit A2